MVRLGGDLFDEDRDNGTPLQVNDTELSQVRGAIEGRFGPTQWRVSGQAGDQTYRQVFSAIAADRNSETLTIRQRVPADQGVSPWVQLVPFALVLAIFYFVILLPMKRRQKKVEQFLESLKVGDKVVTTGGIFGSITKLSDQSIQLQIAPNVRVEVSRAAVVGYQGQAPVADQTS